MNKVILLDHDLAPGQITVSASGFRLLIHCDQDFVNQQVKHPAASAFPAQCCSLVVPPIWKSFWDDGANNFEISLRPLQM